MAPACQAQTLTHNLSACQATRIQDAGRALAYLRGTAPAPATQEHEAGQTRLGAGSAGSVYWRPGFQPRCSAAGCEAGTWPRASAGCAPEPESVARAGRWRRAR